MSRYNRIQHKFTRPLQPVKVDVNGTFIYGIIISKFHKLPKGATIEEPYYIITGHGSPIWENNLIPITDSEYSSLQIGGL
jgi:hypothetical protein